MNTPRLAFLVVACGACFTTTASVPTFGHAVSTMALLERYASGDFEAVTDALAETTDFDQLLKDLKADAPAWITSGGPGDVTRRELAATTFALEAARASEWREWKWLQRTPIGIPVVYWKPAPRLIEWGCDRWRKHATPPAIERFWQLAALAVAQRSEDSQFLIGNVQLVGDDVPAATPVATQNFPPQLRIISRSGRGTEVLNTQDEINHLAHMRTRFPGEKRFMLAEGLARDRDYPNEAATAYRSLEGDPDIGGEAAMRLGALYVRQNRVAEAMSAFDRAERLTRDVYVIHLARVFRGQMLLRQKRQAQAADAFRAALDAWPAAQSASVALAELVFNAGHRSEAQKIMADVLAAGSAAVDPFLEHVHGDDRFWPELIARLRREIRP